jgi:hypothetical protein
MKKYICAFALMVSFVVPQISIASYEVCNLDQYSIVYINGMLNSVTDANSGRRGLERDLNKFNLLDKNDTAVRLAYNPSHLAGAGDGIKVLIQKTYDQMKSITGLDYDSREMLTSLSDEVREGRILFIPHSQGNFYANSMYGWIAKQEGGVAIKSMNMYNVASPTQLSAKKSKYILSKSDKVIAGLVGSVGTIAPPNVNYKVPENSNGHGFVDTYLAYGGNRMINDIKSQLEILETDNTKDQTKPCIPRPEQTASHDILSIFYKVADPVSNVIKDTATMAASLSKGGLSAIASIVGLDIFNKKDINELAENKFEIQEDLQNDFTKDKIDLAQTAPVLNFEESLNPKITLKTKSEVEDDDLAYYLKRIEELKAEVEKQKSQSVKYYGSGSSYNLPTPASSINLDSTPTSTERISSTSTNQTSTSTGSEDNSASSTPEIELILGTDIIEAGSVRVVDAPSAKASPEYGRIMISEYYIGKEGEASWVEIFNTSMSEWVDTSHVIFMENSDRIQFPVTSIAPYSSVILRSDGKAKHSLVDNLIPVSNSLKNYARTEGGFYLLYQNDTGGESAIDFTYYGGGYCKSDYSYSRSCERMVTSVPGNNEEFWVRARVINSNMNPKIYNSVGQKNMAWDYDTYEGRKIKGMYPYETIGKVYYGYASGPIIIPSGTERNLEYYERLWLIKSEAAVFGGKNETRIDVYGKLRTVHTTSIENIDGNNSYINIFDGGILMRDSYTTINAPIKIMGGLARLNFLSNQVILESGKLFITDYAEGGHNEPSKICSDYKNGLTPLDWRSGELYLAGMSCGDREDTNENPDPNKFDNFGIINRKNPKECPVFRWNDNMELECDSISLPPPAEDLPPTNSSSTPPIDNSNNGNSNASTTANSTSPISDSGLNNSTSTDSGANNNSTSSTNNIPSGDANAGENSSSTATSSNNLPPVETSTSTATSTDSGGENNNGEVEGVSTSTPVDYGLTSEGCYNGTLSSITNEQQRNATCGNGWGKRPMVTLDEQGITTRIPSEGRMQITEYHIGNIEGESSWFKVSNMTQGAQLSMYNTDFVINETRLPFPVMGIPVKQYVIIKSPGFLVSPIPDLSFDFGKTTSKYIEFDILPSDIAKEGKVSLLFAWNPFREIVTMDEVVYSSSTCEGEITEYGSCKLNKPPLFWNDISDGFIN